MAQALLPCNATTTRRIHADNALRRGTPQSFIDMETAAPGAASIIWLGYRLRPLLAPLTLRNKTMLTLMKIVLNAFAVVLFALAAKKATERGR